ncbi:MAG: Nif3-like dinuclear metal center hexameric protein [Ignavibacteriaceae bacterium]|nr:Nif3-like dinuclear metal center hexameric protein [Ignavibacteriaceae bacterium]
MIKSEVVKHIESWAPKEIAWSKDNVGLQVGSLKGRIRNILLCLETTKYVVNEAIKNNCNLIISHHPLVFKPLLKIDTSESTNSIIIRELIKNDITLYSAHTNLDFTKDGVSFKLAKKLKLQNIRFLSLLYSNQVKITIFVPESHIEAVSKSIFSAGGGIIGEYSDCSFRIKGTGTFRGSAASNPVIGKKNNFEKVTEIRLEILAYEWKVNEIISAIKKAHPYEEVAFDIYPLRNENVNFGAGAIGILNKKMTEKEFLKYVHTNLKTKVLKYTAGKGNLIETVAVCGGSGSDLLSLAINNNADAFITGDIKYHTFQDAAEKIMLIDAGHYETEIHVLDEVKKRIEKILPDKNAIKVLKYSKSTNPVKFYNN